MLESLQIGDQAYFRCCLNIKLDYAQLMISARFKEHGAGDLMKMKIQSLISGTDYSRHLSAITGLKGRYPVLGFVLSSGEGC